MSINQKIPLDGNKGNTSRKTLLVVLILGSLAAIVYFNSLQNDFVFDDAKVIVQNKKIRSLKNIPRILGFYDGRFREPSYRPMRTISYAIDYFFSDLNPTGYHISNILYHIITSFLVYLTILLLVKNYRVALLAAILFVVHPIQTDSVTYISGRRDILSALFYILGFYCFIKFRRYGKVKYMIFTLIAYVLSMASKEMGFTLPIMFLCYDFIENFQVKSRRLNLHFFKKIFSTLKHVIIKYKYLYGLLLLAGIVIILYMVIEQRASLKVGWYGGSPLLNFLTVARILVFYIKQFIYPLKLNADYSYNAFPISKSFFELQTLFSVIALLGILYGILRLLKNHKLYAFGGMWFFITLLPACHIIPHHELLAEHYLYLPLLGFCLLIALLFDKFISISKRKYIAYAAFVIIVCLFSYRTIARNRDWQDPLTLWKKTTETAPNCARAHYNLGEVYRKNNLFDKAINEYKRVVEIDPNRLKGHLKLALLYHQEGLLDKAIEEYQEVLRIEPNMAEIHYNLSGIYYQKGLIDKAISECNEALTIKPNLVEAHKSLGYLYLEDTKDHSKALFHFKQVLKIAPNHSQAKVIRQIIQDLTRK